MENRNYFPNGIQYHLRDSLDTRVHTDLEKLQELLSEIPNAYEDKCPKCGGEVVSTCRCPTSHRFCECGTMWHWELSKTYEKWQVVPVVSKFANLDTVRSVHKHITGQNG